eukprot:9489847-Pyramimonas_sp.AAC.1
MPEDDDHDLCVCVCVCMCVCVCVRVLVRVRVRDWAWAGVARGPPEKTRTPLRIGGRHESNNSRMWGFLSSLARPLRIAIWAWASARAARRASSGQGHWGRGRVSQDAA